MEEVVELIVSLARKVGELAIVNKGLREANERLNRQIEDMKPFMKDVGRQTRTGAFGIIPSSNSQGRLWGLSVSERSARPPAKSRKLSG